MQLTTQKNFGKIELFLGLVSLVVMAGLLVASVYYQSIWPHKAAALKQLAVYPATAALCFLSGGTFLIHSLPYRYAFQPVFVFFGLIGIGVPIGVVWDVYA